jgi:hypothetical protein
MYGEFGYVPTFLLGTTVWILMTYYLGISELYGGISFWFVWIKFSSSFPQSLN